MSGFVRSLKERFGSKMCNHSWVRRWRDREKRCHKCNEVRPIEKEYTHKDESADIGDTRVRIKEKDSGYRVEMEQYQNTGFGPDAAFFRWFPGGGLYVDESQLEELRDEAIRALNPDIDPEPERCPHGHGTMVYPVGDVLEPAEPYCGECGHISGRGCDDGCYYDE